MLYLAKTRDPYYLFEGIYKKRDQISRKEYSKMQKLRIKSFINKYKADKREEKKIRNY